MRLTTIMFLILPLLSAEQAPTAGFKTTKTEVITREVVHAAASVAAEAIVRHRVRQYFPMLPASRGWIIGNLIGSGIMALGRASAEADRNSESRLFDGVPPPAPREYEPVIDPIATLTIESIPSGAEVLIDAKPRGVTPLTITVPSGPRYVVPRKAGFENWMQDVETKPGDELACNPELVKLPESLNVITIK